MWKELEGTYGFRLTPDSQVEEIIHIYEDGRIVQFVHQHPSIDKRVAMKMRAYPEGDCIFRIKVRPSAEGYLVEIRRDGAGVVIVNKGMKFVCRRLGAQEMPDWCRKELAHLH